MSNNRKLNKSQNSFKRQEEERAGDEELIWTTFRHQSLWPCQLQELQFSFSKNFLFSLYSISRQHQVCKCLQSACTQMRYLQDIRFPSGKHLTPHLLSFLSQEMGQGRHSTVPTGQLPYSSLLFASLHPHSPFFFSLSLSHSTPSLLLKLSYKYARER